MYQRMLIVRVLRALAVNAENVGDEEANKLVRHKEEDRRRRHHDEDHHRGDHGLTAGRPDDLGGLRAHFLQEFERAGSHRL
jgi:hypothetical protein